MRHGGDDMALWRLTFVLLFVTASIGIWLFVGYTFRARIRYPLLLVTTHVISATLTVIAFIWLFITQRHWSQHHATAFVILCVSLVMVLVTYLSGLYFYGKFNVRGRGLKSKLLISHLVMAALSFVCVASSVAELSAAQPPTSHNYPGSMYNFYKHHRK